jgi:hypothetical protein
MLPLLLFFIPHIAPRAAPSALAEFSGQTYTARQVLTAATTFRKCTFRGCQSSADGGALYLLSSSLTLGLVGCTFETCRALDGGGAFLVLALSFSLNETSGRNCSTYYDGFGYVNIYTTVGGSLGVQESSAAACSSRVSTLLLSCSTHSSGSTTRVESLNSSANQVTFRASALYVGEQYRLSLHYATFSGNVRGNVLYLSADILGGDISCVSLVNNTCQGTAGLLEVHSAVTLTNSVFQLNTFKYFVGGSRRAAFSNCVFDVRTLNKTGSASFSTTKCTYNTQRTQFPECSARPPAPVPTAAPISVSIKGSGRNSIVLHAGQEVELAVSAYPIFVFIPSISDVSVAVFDSANAQTATFAAPTSIFAVYFSVAGGRIVVTGKAETTLAYVAAKPSWTSQTYFVSSSPSEKWSASATKGNFTIGSSQDTALLHVSDSATNVAGSYDTDADVDRLYYQYSGSALTSQFYTGGGTFSDVSNYLTVFRWNSAAASVSKSFAVELSSPQSSFPYRNARISGTSASPILVKNEPDQPLTSRTRDVVQAGGRRLGRDVEARDVSMGALAGIAAGIAVMASIGLVLLRRKLKERDNREGVWDAIDRDEPKEKAQ